MKKCLYVSCHETLEWSELTLFSEFEDMEWFSIGAYTYPEGHPTLKRPGIPKLTFNQELADWSRKFPTTDIPQEFIDQFDIIYIMHDPQVIALNWEKMKHKTVVWRTIGQSTPHVENMIRRFKYEGLKIVRMSPMENNIIGFIGGDALIRFHNDLEENALWTGNEKRAINITQSLLGRRQFCHYDSIMQVGEGFPFLVYGSGNTDLGGLNGGELSYEYMKGALRDNRVFIYGGTFPSPYTLALIDALYTGIPVVALGQQLAENIVPEVDRIHYYELPDIIVNDQNGFISDNINELRDAVHNLLEDQELAKKIGQEGRKTAQRLFGREKIKQEWENFFKQL